MKISSIKTNVNTIPKKIFGGNIHRGYCKVACCAKLETYYEKANKYKKLIFCGYSGGGSAAIIATLMLFNSIYYDESNVDVEYILLIIRCITFDAPAAVTKNVIKNCNYCNNFINFIYEKKWVASSSRMYSYAGSAVITAGLGLINPYLLIPATIASVGYLTQTRYAFIGSIYSVFILYLVF